MSVALAVAGVLLIMVLVPVLTNVIAGEISGWSPTWARLIVRRAVARLPEHSRERYDEEWCAELERVPGPISKLAFALRLLVRAGSVSRVVATAAVASPRADAVWGGNGTSVKETASDGGSRPLRDLLRRLNDVLYEEGRLDLQEPDHLVYGAETQLIEVIEALGFDVEAVLSEQELEAVLRELRRRNLIEACIEI